MHELPSSSVVLVLSTPVGVDAACVGCEISSLAGVCSVTADPDRGQLVVRHEPSVISAEEIRACLLPEVESGAMTGGLLAAWPRVAEALPIAASLL